MEAAITIIGTGLAGYTLAREVRKRDPKCALRLITADHGQFYAKPSLSNALAQGKTPTQLSNADATRMAAQLKAEILTQSRVTRLNLAQQYVEVDAQIYPYQQLVLALGAQQRHVPIEGDAASAVMMVNDLDSYQAFRARLQQARHVAIMGAGLIGCEFANDLLLAGYQVSVIDPASTPLNRLMPATAGQVLQKALAELGAQWYLGTAVQAITQQAQGYQLQLLDGRQLQADLVLSAIGLQPQIALAQAAGLKVQQGIVVDRRLQTSVDKVYALGDCAELEGLILPYVMPIMHAARALACTLTGEPTPVHYPAMPVVVKTPACPTVIASPPPAVACTWQLTREGYKVRACCYDTEQQLIGFVLMGEAVGEKQALTQQLPALLA